MAFQKFKEIAFKLLSFKKVTVNLVPHYAPLQKPLQNPLNLEQILYLLGLQSTTSTAKSIIGPRWTILNAKKEFSKLQKQKLNIHAEVQMVLHFSKNGQSFNQLFPYFGCSKYSCFMCSRFLQAHGKISTRGSHGRIFKPWTVPGVSDLAPGPSDILSKALMQLQRDVEVELQMKFKKT